MTGHVNRKSHFKFATQKPMEHLPPFSVQTTPALKEIWCTGPCGRKRRSLQCILSSCLHRAQPNEDSPVPGAKIIGTMHKQLLYPTENI